VGSGQYDQRARLVTEGTTESEEDGTRKPSYLPTGVSRDARHNQADARGPARTGRTVGERKNVLSASD
jgi:hypothetical protein